MRGTHTHAVGFSLFVIQPHKADEEEGQFGDSSKEVDDRRFYVHPNRFSRPTFVNRASGKSEGRRIHLHGRRVDEPQTHLCSCFDC